MPPGYLSSNSVSSPYDRQTVRQFSLKFLMAVRPYSTSPRPSVGFCQLSMWPGELPSTSVNFHEAGCFPSISVSFPCRLETFQQLPSTFRTARIPSVNSRQIYLRLGDFRLTSVNFPCGWETFHHILSTFHASGRPSANFCQLAVRSEYLPSTSVNHPCGLETFRQSPTNSRPAGGPSVKFHQLSVCLGDLPSNSVNFLCNRKSFRQLPSTFVQQGNPPSTTVKISLGR